MTQTQERTNLVIPARRRELPAVPVLIRVPTMAGLAPPLRRCRRRRLRREVRVAALALLCLFPISLGLFLAGKGAQPGTLTVATSDDEAEAGADDAPMLSLPIRLEPIVAIAVAPERDVPVVLPGYLLPADATEEASDGGH